MARGALKRGSGMEEVPLSPMGGITKRIEIDLEALPRPKARGGGV